MTNSSALRSGVLIGPLLLGISVWCAAGAVTVATSDAATTRVVVPAPLWVALLAALAALAVPTLRRVPAVAAPALLSTLPWWPVPLPPIALLWTGPLAWAPIALTLLAAFFRGSTSATAQPNRLDPRRATALAASLTLVIGIAVAWVINPRVPAGDEPHYLVITQSLLKDGDLRIENNHLRRDYAAYFRGELSPDYLRRGRDREIYSIHAPGLSIIVLPGFWGFGYRGAQATMLLLAAVTGGLIWRTAWRVTADSRAAWFAWAAIVGSSTFLLQSVMIFPDGPGAFVVALAAWASVRLANRTDHVRPSALVGVSAALASLPWLHTRFVVLAAGFGLAIGSQLLRDLRSPMAARIRRVAVFGLLPAVSALAWLGFFQVIYGAPDPTAPYGPAGDEHSWTYFPGGLVALLFDQQYGLVACAPVLALAFVTFFRERRVELRWTLWVTAATALAYLAATATYWMWWAGNPATPARFAAAVLPALAIPLAVGWTRTSSGARALQMVLLVLSLGATGVIVGVGRGTLAWNDYDSHAKWLEWLAPVVNLARGWPSFFWRLEPGNLSSETSFFVHVAVWMLVLLACATVFVALTRRRGWNGPIAIAAAAWVFAAAMTMGVQAGWWLNRTNGPDPARSQLHVLDLIGQGRRALTLGGFSVRDFDVSEGTMRIRSEEPDTFRRNPPWALLSDVPAGTYEIHVATNRPQRGELAIRIDHAPTPVRVESLAALSRQRFTLELPVGADVLTVEPDQALRAVGGRVEFVPTYVGRAGLRPVPRLSSGRP